ncbi:hypothetical protein GCM10009528_22790 [Kineococcus aurantiacus]
MALAEAGAAVVAGALGAALVVAVSEGRSNHHPATPTAATSTTENAPMTVRARRSPRCAAPAAGDVRTSSRSGTPSRGSPQVQQNLSASRIPARQDEQVVVVGTRGTPVLGFVVR